MLEDVNLSGAKRPAGQHHRRHGPDASSEFDEVGNTIKEFASDDATVVVGYRDRSGDARRDAASPSSRPASARALPANGTAAGARKRRSSRQAGGSGRATPSEHIRHHDRRQRVARRRSAMA
ncbi:MAG: hypothetical protein MZV65_19940 [Chromatiales bacterium]|nr:hypothetical protein [Chromatiales bacterium]